MALRAERVEIRKERRANGARQSRVHRLDGVGETMQYEFRPRE